MKKMFFSNANFTFLLLLKSNESQRKIRIRDFCHLFFLFFWFEILLSVPTWNSMNNIFNLFPTWPFYKYLYGLWRYQLSRIMKWVCACVSAQYVLLKFEKKWRRRNYKRTVDDHTLYGFSNLYVFNTIISVHAHYKWTSECMISSVTRACFKWKINSFLSTSAAGEIETPAAQVLIKELWRTQL